ncbi:tigger transposable element-derived protein 1-like [Scaptodrosophila lebanonensis]|uniref:Tigger transposable element-derived protein 1-like n=1 Tax=Drosophila lebanonensis TaxID=7225 RepID=A0A6J2UC26_DROLE|nr:tigger transposable element-derived protein 1-like [Scaptodrosophila lebanonensis]
MSETPNIKLRRKVISLETKIEILDRLRNGEGSTFLGKMFGLNEATVRTIKKNETSIRESVISGTKLSAKSSSYTRDATKVKMEKALMLWLEDNAQKRIPVDGNNIKQQALRFYKMIKDEQPSTSTQPTPEKTYLFSASTGWLTGFLQRHALHNIKIKGEIASADQKAAKEFSQKFKEIIADGAYSPNQFFNSDETALFRKKIPRRTYVAKSQKSADIHEMLADKVHSEDDILHASENADSIESSYSEDPFKLDVNLIQEGLQLANKLEYHFVTNDPNVERAAQFQRELNSCMGRYKELYNEVATIGQQRPTVTNVEAEQARESPVQNYSRDDSDFKRKRIRVTDDVSN